MYNRIQATRLLKIYPNQDGRFFITVVGSDKKTYQVKFNAPNQKSNINEFISNYIGKLIQAPVLDGAFIQFSNEMIADIFHNINIIYNGQTFADMSNIKNNELFGIEWKNDIIKMETNEELEIFLEKVSNKKTFYSLYSYDQYLKNYDRHIGNHLILKENDRAPMQYTLIDGDRIFGSLNWDSIAEFYDDFKCLEINDSSITWHAYLYSLINEEDFYFVTEYSIKIEEINEKQLELLYDILQHIYVISKLDCDKIISYLEHRKKDFFVTCTNNAVCFPKITQKRMI